MTLMSMSMILLAIVQDMPKFSMSERKGRGSFSGIPLIGLYYFMLLVIVSFSTVTTSMFVYMERNVRIHNRIPFYLRWLITFEKKKKQLSFRGISTKRRRAHAFENEATQIHSTITPPTHGHLNGFVGSGIVSSQQQLLTDDRQSLLNVHHRLSGSISNSNATTQNVALSLLRLISCDRDSGSCQDKALTGRKKVTVEAPDENCQPDKKLKKRKDEQLNSTEGIKLRKSNSPIPPPPPSPAAAALSQRKRHSLLHAESPLIQQTNILEGMALNFSRLTDTIHSIRNDISALIPQSDLDRDWQLAIRRLEICSLVFYISLLVATMLLFFFHDWYCYIGYNPCGQQNLNCPWLASDPSLTSCLN